jgi:hypothetical protein
MIESASNVGRRDTQPRVHFPDENKKQSGTQQNDGGGEPFARRRHT